MNRNFVLNGEVVDATVRALYSEVSEQLSAEIYYPKHGFTDYEPDIPEEKLSSVSGFGKGILTVAGQVYGSNQKYKGLTKRIALLKPTLINGENLKSVVRRFKATLNNLFSKELQRLSEWGGYYPQAIVRS
jgi:hypothetical protein